MDNLKSGAKHFEVILVPIMIFDFLLLHKKTTNTNILLHSAIELETIIISKPKMKRVQYIIENMWNAYVWLHVSS